ncbi:MAG: metal ABC transporter permease [Methanothrix sp.]|nr:metal ABC transporter permease [Methanothrix sp.]
MMQYEFMKTALVAGLILSVLCGVVGVYIVLNRIVFIGDGVAHAAFGGIGLGYLLGIDPFILAIVAAVLSAAGIGAVSRSKVSEDTAIGVFLAMGMALGVLLMSMSTGYSRDLFDYLFGNILAVSWIDVKIMIVLTVIITVLALALYKEFLILSFDPHYGEALGLPVNRLKMLLLCMVAFTVVMLIKIVGIIMVIAMLTIPAAISRQYLCDLKKIIALSIILGMIFVTSGLLISYTFDLPSGATTILIASAAFFASTAASQRNTSV